jgi:hypothetical protein
MAKSLGEGSRPITRATVARIERQVESGTDADLEHSALGCRDDTGAIGSKIFLPHRPVDQQGNDLILIETHASREHAH